jgi:hypothetical protein
VKLDHVRAYRDMQALADSSVLAHYALLGQEGRDLFRHPERIVWVVQTGRVVVGLDRRGHLAFPERKAGEVVREFILGDVSGRHQSDKAKFLAQYRDADSDKNDNALRTFSPFTHPGWFLAEDSLGNTLPREQVKAVCRHARRLWARLARDPWPAQEIANDEKVRYHSPREVSNGTHTHSTNKHHLAGAYTALVENVLLSLLGPRNPADAPETLPVTATQSGYSGGTTLNIDLHSRWARLTLRFFRSTGYMRFLVRARNRPKGPWAWPAPAVPLAAAAVVGTLIDIARSRYGAIMRRYRDNQTAQISKALGTLSTPAKVPGMTFTRLERKTGPAGEVAEVDMHVGLKLRSPGQARLVKEALLRVYRIIQKVSPPDQPDAK